MTCSHEYSYWETEHWVDDYGNDHCDTKQVSESYYRDIDLHRYKCTQCNKIFYYSQAASDYYEKGIKTDIIGLES